MRLLNSVMAIENIIHSGLSVYLYNGNEVLAIDTTENYSVFKVYYSKDYLHIDYTELGSLYWNSYEENGVSLQDKVKEFLTDETELEVTS